MRESIASGFTLRSSVMVRPVEPPIHVRNLSKVFLVHEREEGMLATLGSLFRRSFKDVPAVQDVSFEIAEGEVVGFLGPNGAGKTTTLKMLSGLLYPTSGEVRVLGHVPSIGLDVTMQARIRRFIAEYNRTTGATILLTSHYMDDVVALCKRVIVIHRGRLLYDGALAGLAERMAPYKLIRVTLSEAALDAPLDAYGETIEREENRVTLRVSREDAPDRTARLVQELRGQVLDLTLEDPPIEEVIDRVFSEADDTHQASLVAST